MIFTIAMRELRSMFLSPLAWTMLAIVQFVMGYLFLNHLDTFLEIQPRLAGMEGAPGVTELVATPVFGNAAIILLLVIPLITMRLIAEERRNQTLPLLFSAPVSMTEIILGKYVGVLGFLLIMVIIICTLPLSLLLGGSLDLGMLMSEILGLSLLLASFAAAGLYMSTLTAQPTIAAMSTFGLLLFLWIVDWAGGGDQAVKTVLEYLSILKHYESLLRGVFKTSDVFYYLLFIITFLSLSIRRLDADRLQH